MLIAVDGGATKTLTALSTRSGEVLAAARTGPSNFQVVGVQAAQRAVVEGLASCLASARKAPHEVAAVAYGLSGADRDADFATVAGFLQAVHPCARHTLVNDTIFALRAGAEDGIGVGVIAGTGTNVIGRDAQGALVKIGGLGLSDWGGAGDLGREAVNRALRCYDGREPPTLLYPKLCEHLGLLKLEDLAERSYFDREESFDFGTLAPVVFECSKDGDECAREILECAASEYALAASTAVTRLLGLESSATVVLGGSLLQKGADPFLVERVRALIALRHPRARVLCLEVEPVIGGLLLARDLIGWDLPQAAFRSAAERTLRLEKPA